MNSRFGMVFNRFLDHLGGRLARKLTDKSSGYHPFTPSDFKSLCGTLQPGDVVLVEGRERVSNAIKYLTQSTPGRVAYNYSIASQNWPAIATEFCSPENP